ncbi:hypothetical protein HanRHA438_Chr02g0086761 [Helianthus annuus]|nr:hypothetical protein HanRHA438_Chr02g0086761 [Helianthus annuus]
MCSPWHGKHQYTHFRDEHYFHSTSDCRRPFWAWTSGYRRPSWVWIVVCCGFLSVSLALMVVWKLFCFEILYIVDLEPLAQRCRQEP